MKNLIFCFFSMMITVGLTGQETFRIFLNDNTAGTLKTSTDELSGIVNAITKSLETKDSKAAIAQKGRLVRILNSTSNTMYNLSDIIDRNIDIRKNPSKNQDDSIDLISDPCDGFFAVHISSENNSKIKSNTVEMHKLYEKIQNNGYSVHPLKENALENSFVIKRYYELLQENVSIIDDAKDRT